jgi:hypothetical protein
LREEESVSVKAEPLSFDWEREATTIEPLVKGQQFMASLCVGVGKLNCVNSGLIVRFADCVRLSALCFALQQACAPIDPDICAIG